MNIWGKIIGGCAGFAVGGPIGAFLGAVAGHAVDNLERVPAGQPRSTSDATDETQRVAFTIGVIVLAAKMAKADGAVTEEEISAFREVFQISPEEERNVDRLFQIAHRDSRGFEPYAKQIAFLLRNRRQVLEKLLESLFHIARADGSVTEDEVAYLRSVASIFGISEQIFARIRAGGADIASADPYAVLGVTRDADDAQLKAAHRRLIRANHPDRLIATGMASDLIAIATQQTARINGAWDQIKRERRL